MQFGNSRAWHCQRNTLQLQQLDFIGVKLNHQQTCFQENILHKPPCLLFASLLLSLWTNLICPRQTLNLKALRLSTRTSTGKRVQRLDFVSILKLHWVMAKVQDWHHLRRNYFCSNTWWLPKSIKRSSFDPEVKVQTERYFRYLYVQSTSLLNMVNGRKPSRLIIYWRKLKLQ